MGEEIITAAICILFPVPTTGEIYLKLQFAGCVMVEILIINLYVRRVHTICNSALVMGWHYVMVLVMGQTEGKCTDFTDHESSIAHNFTSFEQNKIHKHDQSKEGLKTGTMWQHYYKSGLDSQKLTLHEKEVWLVSISTFGRPCHGQRA
jgi:hypothetical protein